MMSIWKSKQDLYDKYGKLLGDSEFVRQDSDPIRIMFLGEFNAGKSSLTNAILGDQVLPVDIFQTTATINRITNGSSKSFSIIDHDGKVLHKDNNLENLHNFNADCGSFENIKWIEITHPAIPRDIELIDTPGFNDPDPIRDKTFLSMLPSVDIMLFICDANQALKGSELPYIKKYFLNSLSRVKFVFNHSDTLKNQTKIKFVSDAVGKQVAIMLDEAATLFEKHDCMELAESIRVNRAEDFFFFVSAALEGGLLSEGLIDSGLKDMLNENFSTLKNYIFSLTSTRQVLLEEWKLNKFLETLLSRRCEIESAIHAVESGNRDEASLRDVVKDRLARQLDAANKHRKAISNLPNKIEYYMESEISTFLNKLETQLSSIGDDFGGNFVADQYQKEMQGITQKLTDGVKKIIQDELNFVHEYTAKLESSDLTLKNSLLPSHAKRQHDYSTNMASNGIATALGGAAGFFLFGPIGAMIGSALVGSSVQVGALKDQRSKLDRAYKAIIEDARRLLDRVKADVTQSVRSSTIRFETEWLKASKSTQWQVLELVNHASSDRQAIAKNLASQRKKIECGIRECQIATMRLRS